ncbi:MAG: Mrp/NBP35 family ATP-binding protein [Sphaerochaetaceae bacterium]|nr:Mrp/NBP35 family ATP-binding protein [Sphaerochaetaceae bacterium]
MPEKYSESQNVRICERMDQIGRKILIMSGKGGVGKTTTTVNLANALLAQGHTVGVLDTDIHGPNVAKMFGCEEGLLLTSPDGVSIEPISPRPGLKVVSLSFALENPDDAVIFRGAMKTNVIKQFIADVNWGTLDYLLIDSPPGTGDEQLTVAQSIPAMTGTILVTTPQQVAVMDVKKSVSFARQLNMPIIGLIENMSYMLCPHCGEKLYVFGKDGGKNLCKEESVPFLGEVPMEMDLQSSEDRGDNWIESSSSSASAKAFSEIATFLHLSTKPSCSADVGYVPQNESCSPSSCASCQLDCPSKKS